jgi:enolase
VNLVPNEAADGGTLRSAVPNQLLRIEEELGADARYPGWDVFPRSAR